MVDELMEPLMVRLFKVISAPDIDWEVPDIVNVRVMSLAEVAKLGLPELSPQKGAPKEVARRKVLFEEAEGYIDTPIFDRASLGAGAEIAGPAIVEQLDSTTVIMPGQTAQVERYGNIIIDIGAAS